MNKRVDTHKPVKLELIRSWDGLVAISDQWNDLLSDSWADTIFLRWEWVSVWKDTCIDDIEPFVITVREDNDNLIGLVPFYQTEYRLLNIVRYKVLHVIGDSASGSEYPAWIISKEHESKNIYNLIVNMLESHAGEWDWMWMKGVRVFGGQARNIHGIVKKKYYINSRKNNSSSIDLRNYKKESINSLSRNKRSQLRRDLKKVLVYGEVHITKCENRKEIDQYLDVLFKLHNIRWQSKGLKGMFERLPWEMDFYRHFATAALENGWLRLYVLHQEGVIKAVQIGYVYNNIYCQLQEGFDPEHLSGAGNVLRLHVTDECVREGLTEYDFLGGYTEHKRRWGSRERACYDLFIGRKSLKNLLIFVKNIWPTGRFLKISK
ncbi:MAG TPA: GNAT family N-acetyltransferase [Gammaproteobacteria bacterium]|nr:GNAT family N-acetyltransferase [Gammaproteobacteria bacterium]